MCNLDLMICHDFQAVRSYYHFGCIRIFNLHFYSELSIFVAGIYNTRQKAVIPVNIFHVGFCVMGIYSCIFIITSIMKIFAQRSHGYVRIMV